jgi:hypothetical protein
MYPNIKKMPVAVLGEPDQRTFKLAHLAVSIKL